MKRSKTAALTLALAISVNPWLGAATAYADSGREVLPSGEDYTEYQWALKNTGTIQRSEQKLKFQALDQVYVSYGEHGIDSIYLPPLGPSSYDAIKTEAYPGIDINIAEAWNIADQTEQKRPVTVALIDTGVDIRHSELSDALWTNPGEIPDDGIDNDGNGYVDDIHGWNFVSGNNQLYVGKEDFHGTHGAGTIAAARGNGGIDGIAGNAPVKLMVLKALGGKNGMGTPENVLAAIRYAEAAGAQICNLSFGSDRIYPEMEAAIRDSKMLFVIATGNGNRLEFGYNIDERSVFPASLPYDNIITVGNLLFNGKLDESSNYGAQNVDLAAPGTYILSTAPEETYSFMSGTSMAAPMVTGAAALIYSARPDLSLTDVKTAILSTAHKLAFLKGRTLTGGMLDVSAAMKWQKN